MKIYKKTRIFSSYSDPFDGMETPDAQFTRNGVTYYISIDETFDGSGYVAYWWDSSDNGLGYDNKGFVGFETDSFRLRELREHPITKQELLDNYLYVRSSYDRIPNSSICRLLKEKVMQLVDFSNWYTIESCVHASNRIHGRRITASVNKQDAIDAIQYMYGMTKKEALEYYRNTDEQTLQELVNSFKYNARNSFYYD